MEPQASFCSLDMPASNFRYASSSSGVMAARLARSSSLKPSPLPDPPPLPLPLFPSPFPFLPPLPPLPFPSLPSAFFLAASSSAAFLSAQDL